MADTTLSYDRNVKLPRYAASGVPEAWIESLENDLMLVFRNPIDEAYPRRSFFVSPFARLRCPPKKEPAGWWTTEPLSIFLQNRNLFL